MFSSIEIINFRSFRRSSIKKLGRLNLVTGKNGSGKSTLLEALFLNCSAANPLSIFAVNTQRGAVEYSSQADASLRSLFFNQDPKNAIQINCEETIQKRARLRSLRIDPLYRQSIAAASSNRSDTIISGVQLSFKRPSSEEVKGHVRFNDQPAQSPFAQPATPPPQPVDVVNPANTKDLIEASYISPYSADVRRDIHRRLVASTKSGRMSAIVKRLRVIKSEIETVIPLVEFGQEFVYVDLGPGRLMPLASLGSGFVLLLRIALEIDAVGDGIVVIDELEDGLHYSIVPEVAKMLIQSILETDIQIFITSHSDELIKALIRTAEEANFSEMSLINLIDGAENVDVRQFSVDELFFSADVDAELR